MPTIQRLSLMAKKLVIAGAFAGCVVLQTSTLVRAEVQVYTNEDEFLEEIGQCATTLTFDEYMHLETPGIITDVDFGDTSVIYNEVSHPSGGAWQSPPNVLLNANPPEPIVFTLLAPTNAIGFWNTSIVDREQVTLFDEFDNIVYVGELPEGSVKFLGVISENFVTRGEVVGIRPQTFGTIFIDSFSYGIALSCSPDLQVDGVVDAADLAQFLGAWGPNPGHPADFTCDGVVGPVDLALLLGAWGPCPRMMPPS